MFNYYEKSPLFLKRLLWKRAYKEQKLNDRFLKYNSQAKFKFTGRVVSATFKHSGHTGDVIYALPTIKAITDRANLFLNTSAITNLAPNYSHPYGKFQLTQQAVKMLKTLLEHQNYISTVGVYAGQNIDFDLDEFRLTPQRFDAGNISAFYFPLFGISPDLSQPWISAPFAEKYAEHIVLARSSRYRNHSLNYAVLHGYKNVGFVGLKDEFVEMQRVIPHLEYLECTDFLQVAAVIRSCKLFIGNQSFPFSLAEAMKVNRLLEVCPSVPNVIPQGGVGHAILFQKQFEYVLETILADSI